MHNTVINLVNKYKIELIIIVIFLIGFYFRFHNFPFKYAFDFDPSRDALLAYYGSRNFQFPLIGASSGIGAFSFGPWYYWQLILFSIIFPSLWAPWIYIGICSLGFMVVMYKIGQELEGKTFGIILLLLATFSPAQVGPTAGLSNPNLIPLHAALTIYMGILFSKNKLRLPWVFVWGLVVGIGINNHFQMLLLLVFPGVILLLQKFERIKRIVVFIFGLSVSFLPLLVFNFVTNWQILRGFSSFLTNTGSATYVPNSWTIYVTQFWPAFFTYILGVPLWLGGLYVLGVILAFSYALCRHRIRFIYWVLAGCFLSIFTVLRYYSGERQYYYLLFLHPFIFLFVGYAGHILLSLRKGWVMGGIILASFLIYTIPMDLQRGNYREENMEFNAIAQDIINKYPTTTTIALYNCLEKEESRVQGAAFFLLTKGITISSRGEKIGIADNECVDIGQLPQNQKTFVNLSTLPSRKLEMQGWRSITPELVYKETVLWWQK